LELGNYREEWIGHLEGIGINGENDTENVMRFNSEGRKYWK
jgi:hypothetical protein